MRQCAICGKSSQMGGAWKKVKSKYDPVNWSRKQPNLQWAKVKGVRKLICTRCLKTLHKK